MSGRGLESKQGCPGEREEKREKWSVHPSGFYANLKEDTWVDDRG